MSLSDLLAASQTSSLGDDQGAWRQFVLDHLDYIALRSTTYTIDPPLMNLYRYDLRRFLTKYLKRNEDIAWIVQLINDVPNDLEFKEGRNYIIPPDNLMQKLYHSYITIASNAS